MIVTLAVMMSLVLQATPRDVGPVRPPRPVAVIPYDEVVRCAGLTQAASELEGGESAEGQKLFDAALYWSLSAGQAATIAGRDAEVADADQTRARIRAVQQLNANVAEAHTQLQRCRQRVPDLG